MQNFYEATVTRQPYPQLTGTIDTQVCIVGGGLAGLCTALGLVERGVHDVVVLDSPTGRLRRIGPQRRFRVRRLQPRQRRPAAHPRPRRRARELYRLTVDAVELIRARIARYGIDCDAIDPA